MMAARMDGRALPLQVDLWIYRILAGLSFSLSLIATSAADGRIIGCNRGPNCAENLS